MRETRFEREKVEGPVGEHLCREQNRVVGDGEEGVIVEVGPGVAGDRQEADVVFEESVEAVYGSVLELTQHSGAGLC